MVFISICKLVNIIQLFLPISKIWCHNKRRRGGGDITRVQHLLTWEVCGVLKKCFTVKYEKEKNSFESDFYIFVLYEVVKWQCRNCMFPKLLSLLLDLRALNVFITLIFTESGMVQFCKIRAFSSENLKLIISLEIWTF